VAKKTNPIERTTARRPIAHVVASRGRQLVVESARISYTLPAFIMPFYALFPREPFDRRPRGVYARVRTCGRGIRAVRGVSAVYAVEDIPRRRMTRGIGKERRKGSCIPVGLFCSKRGKGESPSRDAGTSPSSSSSVIFLSSRSGKKTNPRRNRGTSAVFLVRDQLIPTPLLSGSFLEIVVRRRSAGSWREYLEHFFFVERV